MRIALVSDTHTNHGMPDDQPLYRGHLDQVIAQVNAAQVDLVLIAGDLTESGDARDQIDFQSQVAGFQAPVHVVPGNHDIGNKATAESAGTVTTERCVAFERAHGPAFWSVTCCGVRIVAINSPILGSGLLCEAEQWVFLERELAQPGALPTLLLTHYPPFTQRPDEPSDRYWNIEPEPRRRLLALLRQAGVTLVLSGHLHSPRYLQQDGITYITTHPVSFGLPFGLQSEGWTLVILAPDGGIAVHPHDILHDNSHNSAQ